MDLQFSDEQSLLRDMVDRLVVDHHGFDRRDHATADGWARFAELGLLMLPFAETDGGTGGGGIEAMIVGEAFGRGLVALPYLACAVLSATALAHCPPSAERTACIAALIAGDGITAVADTDDIRIENGRLRGHAKLVLGGDAADQLIVTARDAENRATLALIATDAPGVTSAFYRLHGGLTAADFHFDRTPIQAILAGPIQAAAIATRAREAATAFFIAEALGASQAIFDLTLTHLKTREQFGRPLGVNQALQHRAAEMFVELEQLRSAALYAAMLRDAPEPAERARGLGAAQFVAARAARVIGQQAIQLHGGIGVTEEYAAGHYFRRLTAIAMLFGDADAQLDTLAAAGGFVSATPYWDAEG